MGLWDKFKNAAEKTAEAGRTQDYNEEEATVFADEMAHDVSPNELRRKQPHKAPIDLLREDESPRYLLSGLDFDIDDNDQGSQSTLFVTDSRIIIMSQSITMASNRYTINYEDIIGVAISRRVTAQIRIQTAGHEYKVSVALSSSDLAEECVEFIRRKTEHGESDQDANLESEEEDALSKLERLADLRDQGAITEEEFDEKKSNLLDRI